MDKEKRAVKVNGFFASLVALALTGYFLYGLAWGIQRGDVVQLGYWLFQLALVLLTVCIASGLMVVQPNHAKAVIFLGSYVGTVRDQGFWWTWPFTSRKEISLRIRNLNSERLKVNDARGNPIEVAAVVVWRVVDTARALFEVDDYEGFVSIQSETALRGLASHFPYDPGEENEHSLRGSRDVVAAKLKQEVEERLVAAGVEVIETRLSHLAYAPEIAQAMLRRQQAEAIIAARQKIVEGAVGMVQMALRSLNERKIVELDEERKAAMVNNLLVVLTAESEVSPVINAGTIY